jgi:hypothetical protein
LTDTSHVMRTAAIFIWTRDREVARGSPLGMPEFARARRWEREIFLITAQYPR